MDRTWWQLEGEDAIARCRHETGERREGGPGRCCPVRERRQRGRQSPEPHLPARVPSAGSDVQRR